MSRCYWGPPGVEMLYIKELLIILLLTSIVLLAGGDMVYDFHEGASTTHMVIEIALIVVSFSLVALLVVELWRQTHSIRRLKSELQSLSERQQDPVSPEMQEARHNLAVVADRQFTDWELTQTEKEVAMLLLKGLSFKEIAAVRNTVEKTVRQQASAIYRKSGLNGRHAFAAWFIEDFL